MILIRFAIRLSISAGRLYYLQSLTDMRLEPRWNPNLADATQMKANFFARIMAAAKDFEKNIKSSELRNLVLGTGSGSLRSLSEFPRLYYPGPLEGTENRLNILPTEVSEAIKDRLGAKKNYTIVIYGSGKLCIVLPH